MERLQRLPWMAVTHRVERLPWRPMAAVWIIWAVGTLGVAGTRFTGKTVPNLHVLQARALLSGRLDIARPDIEGLEHDNLEVVRAKGRYYAPFPIFPAVLLVPLVALLGTTNLAAFILAFALAALLFDGHGEGAKIVGNLRIFRRQRIDVANLDIDRLYARPFGARTEEPAVTSDHTRGVERIAGNQELQQLPAA